MVHNHFYGTQADKIHWPNLTPSLCPSITL
jgi:hypothetical protein